MDINKAIDDNLPSALSELDNEIEAMLDKIVEKAQLRSELDILAKIKGKFNPVILPINSGTKDDNNRS